MAKYSQKWGDFLLIFGQFCIAIFDPFPVSMTPSVYTQNDQRRKLYKKGLNDSGRFRTTWAKFRKSAIFPENPGFLADFDKNSLSLIRKFFFSGRPCEPADGSSDPIGISIGQYWDDKNIESVVLAIRSS